MSYNGPDRRKMNDYERDRDRLLTRIDANLENLCRTVIKHTEDDETAFAKQADQIKRLQEAYWKTVGGLVVIGAVLQVTFKLIKI